MPHRSPLFVSLLSSLLFCFFISATVSAQEKNIPQSPDPKKLSLVQAAMCEDVKERSPKNQAIVFSAGLGKVICFTSFDPVPSNTVIYHNWFYLDEPKSKIKLTLKPPKWATFSRIKLRDSDKGPWRVEVRDAKGKILKTLRFSIVD